MNDSNKTSHNIKENRSILQKLFPALSPKKEISFNYINKNPLKTIVYLYKY